MQGRACCFVGTALYRREHGCDQAARPYADRAAAPHAAHVSFSGERTLAACELPHSAAANFLNVRSPTAPAKVRLRTMRRPARRKRALPGIAQRKLCFWKATALLRAGV